MSSPSSPASDFTADVCIIGSGPAAISCALGLEGSGLTVILVETGAYRHDPVAEEIGRTERGLKFGTVDCAFNTRRFGGNANAWLVETGRSSRGVRLAPFLDADFEPRPGIPDTGWPIARAEMEEHYKAAEAVFGLPDPRYDADAWATEREQPLPIEGGDVRTFTYHFGDGHVFTDVHREKLAASRTVTILTQHTVTGLESDPTGTRVVTARLKTADGAVKRVAAAEFVIAGGGLGTTQLLLNALADDSLRIGPAAENVGRWFIDHPLLYGGEFIPADRAMMPAMGLYDLKLRGDTPVMGHLQLSDAAMRREEVLNMSVMFFPRSTGWQMSGELSQRQNAGFQAAIRLRSAVRDKRIPPLRDAVEAIVGLDGVAKRLASRVLSPSANLVRGGWSDYAPKHLARFDRFEILHVAEQAPHRDNRVLLGEERDSTGMRRLTIDWQWHAEDRARTMRGQEIFARALAQSGLGEFQIARDGDGPSVISSTTGHWMGLTRMSTSPQTGVVDTDCRVHGTDNLSIASSSVFPTGGYANPTLTVVAVSLRIARRLARSARQQPLTVAA